MKAASWMVGLGLVAAALGVGAEEAVTLKYRFSPGQVLRYEGTQVMKGESTVAGMKHDFRASTGWLREWRVLSVDEKGNVRLSLSILRARVETITPDGSKITFDTEKEDANNPLRSVVGRPLVEVVLSQNGQILDFGQPQASGAGHFLALLRTQLYALPVEAVAAGAGWQNDIPLPLPAPLGKEGEAIRIRQSFRLEKVADSVATINFASGPAEEIKDRARLAAIAQFLPSGKLELDMTRGVLRRIELTLDQTVSEFAGTDSQMHVTGTYREVLQDDVAGNPAGRKK